MQAGGHSDQGFPGARLPITGDKGDFRIEKGIKKTFLPDVQRLEMVAVGDPDDLGKQSCTKSPSASRRAGMVCFFAARRRTYSFGLGGPRRSSGRVRVPVLAKAWSSVGSTSMERISGRVTSPGSTLSLR